MIVVGFGGVTHFCCVALGDCGDGIWRLGDAANWRGVFSRVTYVSEGVSNINELEKRMANTFHPVLYFIWSLWQQAKSSLIKAFTIAFLGLFLLQRQPNQRGYFARTAPMTIL